MSPTPSSHPSALSEWSARLLNHEPSQRPRWLRWGFAIAVTVLALWLRIQIGSPASGARFATLTLATVLSALYGGISAGLLSTVLGMVLANFFMIAPFGQLAVRNPTEAFWLNAFYLVTQLVILGAIGVMQQRNQRLQELTQQLSDSQRKFQNTFEHAAAGITHVGLQGQLLEVNQTFCQLVGYSEDELRRMSFQDITLPEDVGPDLQMLEDTLARRRNHYSLEKRYRHKDGHIIWGQVTVSLIRKPDGSPHYFISVVQDISEVKATQEALRTSESLMRQAQGVARFVTWEADLTAHCFRTLGDDNDVFDLPSGSFTNEVVLSLTHPEDHQRLKKEWIAALKGHGPFQGTYRGHPQSPVRWFQVSAHFDWDANGQAVRAYGISQDISTRKLAELEIRHLNASLEQRIQERTQELKDAYAELESYSYAVAHDLRSPLRIINGFAQALQEDNLHLSEASKTHLHRIKSSSQRMGMLIDGLLKLAQYARGEVVRQPVNISTIATTLLEELANDDPQRQVHWSIEPDLIALADPALVEALLQNLLSNAWKYSAHTDSAHIRIYKQTQGTEVFFCVSDNGAGFDMAHAAKLYQPFQRLHMPNEFHGLGVGLATAQRIVKRHGGELRAMGEPGKGATFSFSLPTPA
jgi:PAS domain S-box-containing protein